MEIAKTETMAMTDDIKQQTPTGSQNSDTDGDTPCLRILLAEDHKVNQMLATTMLENLGHSVDLVVNGAEAVEAVKSTAYDLVLMDVQMPVMNGVDATIAIRNLDGRGARIPVIAMTANAMQGDREQYLAAGMDDYIAKPIILVDLAGKVLEWGSKRSECGVVAPAEQ